jgi:hypothetical protein
VLVYRSAPAAYLLSGGLPVAPFLMLGEGEGAAEGTSRAHADFTVGWMERPGRAPTVAVVDRWVWDQRASAPRDYLLDYIDREFEVAVSRPHYVILRKKH